MMIASAQQIQELRAAFLQKLENDGAPDSEGFHPADMDRVKNTDAWLKRFLEHNDLDMKISLHMLWDTCDWRKKFGTNELSETNIRMEYIHDGSFFGHSHDVDGKALFIFKGKKHVRGQKDLEDLKRCLVYWIDRMESYFNYWFVSILKGYLLRYSDKGDSEGGFIQHQIIRENNGEMITVFFDMADSGLGNMDMEFIKYIINLFKQYYPNFLNYIVIFEMPWILNAAFKIVKSLLPAKAVAKLKFVNKSNVKELVAPEKALKCWGGLDDYEFTFVSEERSVTASVKPTSLAIVNNLSESGANRKVHFADGSPMNETNSTLGLGEGDGGEMLSITPAEAITFAKEGTEMSGCVSLTNIEKFPITYKIKTTSPEKFRVRPSTGILNPGSTSTVSVVLQPGYQVNGMSKDKFLIMAIALNSGDASNQELGEIWKNPASQTVEQHRLRCVLPVESVKNGSILTADHDVKQSHVQAMLARLTDSNDRLVANMKFMQTLQFITIGLMILLAMAVVYILRVEFQNSTRQYCVASDHTNH